MNITVLAGGLSPERDVSLTSASLIANALEKKGHAVCLADIYEGVDISDKELLACDKSEIFRRDKEYSYTVPKEPPSIDKIIERNGNRRDMIGPGIITLCRLADVVYIGLHGGMGENGMLQAILDSLGIKYTGTGYVGSLLAMDKDISKRLMRAAGVTTADWVTLKSKEDCERALMFPGLPLVVKPSGCGSSVGVSIVETEEELVRAFEAANNYGCSVIAEKKISGREFTISILESKALPAVEIIPKSGFYDYKNKYQDGMTEEKCPASLTESEKKALKDAAFAVFRALKLEDFARMDFILSKDDGKFYCLEANTLPGMTPQSILPKEAAAAEMDYETLCDKIATLGYDRIR